MNLTLLTAFKCQHVNAYYIFISFVVEIEDDVQVTWLLTTISGSEPRSHELQAIMLSTKQQYLSL